MLFNCWAIAVDNGPATGADLDRVDRVPEPGQHFQIDQIIGFKSKTGIF